MGYQNFYATKLATDIGASDTTIELDTPPTVTSGRLTLEARNASQREIISFTGVSGNDLTGVTRGVGGTTAKTHIKGALVEMNVTAEDLSEALSVPEDIEERADELFNDHVASGLVWSIDTGLIADMTAGVLYINGLRLEVAAVTGRAFTASRDTYIDIGDNGVIDYTEETNGDEAPALAANHLRIARVITDGSGITGITTYPNPSSLKKEDGWQPLGVTLTAATGYNKGNRHFVLDTASDLTGVLSPGMRLKVNRSLKAPTQCVDLERDSSQYASKSSPSGITFTDDFTLEAWIKIESYNTSDEMVVVSRFGSAGWIMRISTLGQLEMVGQTGATSDIWKSDQAVPLGRWVHVAATLDLSGNVCSMYIDGASVNNTQANNTTASLTQDGNLNIGSRGTTTELFDGKISDVRVWSDIRTATEILDNMNHQLVGNETDLVAYFKLDGNLEDSTVNANHLTGSGGAAATDADNPFKDTEYGIITAVDSSTVTVFTGTDHTMPNMTLLRPYYSTQKCPHGFPAGGVKWEGAYKSRANINGLLSFAINNPTASATPIPPLSLNFTLTEASDVRIVFQLDLAHADTFGWGISMLKAGVGVSLDAGDLRSGYAGDTTRTFQKYVRGLAAGTHSYTIQLTESGSTSTSATVVYAEFVAENLTLGELY